MQNSLSLSIIATLVLALAIGLFLFFNPAHARIQMNDTAQNTSQLETAIFAGGCFWCMEKPFDHVKGVTATVSGYSGGHLENPTYKQVSSGTSGHVEVLQVTYDPAVVSYDQLLDVFWRNIDPFDAGGQFCDRGSQYRSEIFAVGEAQKNAAIASKAKHEKLLGRDIVTQITDASTFYPAEDYHQDYYNKNPIRYRFYRGRCGRDDRLEEVWGNIK